jgi:hypothetical protein
MSDRGGRGGRGGRGRGGSHRGGVVRHISTSSSSHKQSLDAIFTGLINNKKRKSQTGNSTGKEQAAKRGPKTAAVTKTKEQLDKEMDKIIGATSSSDRASEIKKAVLEEDLEQYWEDEDDAEKDE